MDPGFEILEDDCHGHELDLASLATRQDLLRLGEFIEVIESEVLEGMEGLTKQLHILSSQLLRYKENCYKFQSSDAVPVSSLVCPPDRHPGYPWERNSCWLDSALQIIYMAVKPDCQWNAFVTYATAGRHGGMYHLYEILARRKAHGDIDSLRLQRNEFRTYLMKNNIIRADSAYLPVFAWLGSLIHRDTEPGKLKPYFQSLYMHLRICKGLDQTHLQISKIAETRSTLIPTAIDYSRCQGDLQAYWDVLTDLKLRPGHCWRTMDGIKQCSGVCQFLEVTLAVPIFLIFEPEPMTALESWDFPTVLHALPNRDASVVFHLVGRVLHSGEKGNFQALYLDAADSIHHYDGMINGGYCSFLGHGSLGGTDIALKAIPAGFRTNCAIYRLRGGPEAQDKFYSHQTTSCSLLGVSISPRIGRDIRPEIRYQGSIFTPLPDEQRFWLRDPYRNRSSAEYVAL